MLRLVPPWVYGIAVALALGGAFWGGYKVADWRCDAEKLEAVQRAIKRANEARDKVHEESTNYETEREQGRVEAAERQDRVRTIYRDVEVPASCEPPADAGELLDDALRAAANRAAGQSGG